MTLGPACFSVADVLDGLFQLERRSPTLRGSVPLRVAQACVPLLQGNEFGWQVVLRDKWPLGRGPLGFSLALDDTQRAALRARYAQGIQRAVDRGLLVPGSPWHRHLLRDALFCGDRAAAQGRLGRRPRLCLFTGLFVRPDPGLCLRLLAVGNRRPRSLDLTPATLACLPDGASGADLPIPLCLDIALSDAGRRSPAVQLGGELACLAPMPLSSTFVARPLAQCPELGRAHAAFYDASYFRRKEGGATRRYRKQVQVRSTDAATTASPGVWLPPAASEVVVAGPTDLDIVGEADLITAAGPQPVARPPSLGVLQHVVFRSLLPFRAWFDGATVALDFDRALLERRAQPLWQQFRTLYGAPFVDAHPGALLYLTKYFTTHPPGEPHFFVKPWTFTRTPPGVSVLLDGVAGDGYDVLRGVVATDQFHATPAVFAVQRTDDAIDIPARAPLLRMWAVPRDLLAATFRRL